MRLQHSIPIALEGLKTNRTRSALTILGIVIGITAIILIMAIGQGAENLILNEISGLGSETVVIRPGQEPSGPTDIAGTLFEDSLKKRDIEFLQRKSNVPHLTDIMPIVVVPGSASYQGETTRPQIYGASAEFFGEAFNLTVKEGSLFGNAEIGQAASIAVIGSKVEEELFGNRSALGEQIQIRDRKFRITGVLPPTGQVAFLNFDETILIPYTTAQTYLLGIDHFHEVIVKTEGPEFVDRTVRDIEETLRIAHGIDDPEKDDFFVATQQGVIEQVRVIIGSLTAFLSAVVAIALVVGGIGVMNIMLVSVTERTREIGLRKAVGATNQDILVQFLLESMFLTLMGGIIGIAFGVLLSLGAAIVLSQVLELSWEFVFPVFAVVLGLAVAAFVGLVFGLYPARQASKKSPIEALRYE